MKILIACNKFPYPPDDGSSLAIFTIISELATIPDVKLTVFSLNTKKHYKNPEKFPKEIRSRIDLYSVNVDTDITPFRTVANLFSGAPFHVSRFINTKTTREFSKLLSSSHFDLVHLESVFMATYLPIIRELSSAKVAIRLHNIEHLLWKRHARKEPNPIKKWYLQLQAKRLEAFEKRSLQEVDALVPITQVDAYYIIKNRLSSAPICVIPFGINSEKYLPAAYDHSKRVMFLGSMDWMPNQIGIEWFLNKVWPLVVTKDPDMQLIIAGKNAHPELLKRKYPNVEMRGTVADAKDFINSGNLFIVPILSGSGMRIKMLEAMALGRCILSTRIGAEGIAGNDGEHYILRDDAEAFANELLHLASNRKEQEKYGKNARSLVLEKYNNKNLIAKLIQFYNTP